MHPSTLAVCKMLIQKAVRRAVKRIRELDDNYWAAVE